MTIRKKYVEIEIPDEQNNRDERNNVESKQNATGERNNVESRQNATGEQNATEELDDIDRLEEEKDLQIPLEKLEKMEHPKILIDIALRLGKMRIQDIACDLHINIPTVKKYRKEIFSKLSEIQKAIIINQEQKIEELRERILTGKMKRRLHSYSFGVEGLVRGIVRDLTRQGKSISQIVEQTNLETSTISYHREKIKNGKKENIIHA